jgi:LuxR family maltose regulon positive regulatory protein
MILRRNLTQKALVPRRQLNTIRRSHLIDTLYQGLQQKVSIVTAPAGSGKTTVVTDFAGEVDIQVCWYTINASDTDPRSLLEGIIAAFSQKFPQIGQVVIPILESSMQPEKQANSIIDTLAHEINASIPEYMLFVKIGRAHV